MNLIIEEVKTTIDIELDILASDKSISHRVCMFALFADSNCKVSHFLNAEDTQRSLKIAQLLGLSYKFEKNGDLILTPPSGDLQEPHDILYCGNSGTSMRLYSGLLAGANIYAVLSGDKYLHKRPMGRIVKPLRSIGANIATRQIRSETAIKELAPISIIPTSNKLNGFKYHSNIASAQVKSSLILAGLQAKDKSNFTECSLSRNHTENILNAFQHNNYLTIKDNAIEILPFNSFSLKKPLKAFDITIPNDPSSAFFFAVLASIIPNACVTLKRVMLNKTRIEAFNMLESMGANIQYENIKNDYEKVGDITIKNAELKAIEIKDNIAWLIDEIPALSIACSVAKGVSKIRNAGELRVKESDRITTTIEGLKSFGIQTKEYKDGFDIVGGTLKYGKVDSKGDHRIAMSFAIAACVCGGEITNCECINTSFPNFIALLKNFSNIKQNI